MTEPIAWINGRMVAQSEAAVPISDLGVSAGATVSEMIRTFALQPFRLSDHLDRLERSIETVRFETPFDRSFIEAAAAELVEHNGKLIPGHHDLGINVFVTAGHSLSYLGAAGRSHAHEGTVCVNTFPLPFELWADRYATGLQFAQVSVRALPPDVIDPRVKHRNRLHWFLADREARERFPGSTAVPVTADGVITETSTGNILSVSGRTITTSPPNVILNGVSQEVVSNLALDRGFERTASAQTWPDLSRAAEIVVSSTHYCLMPVTRLEHELVGDVEPGSFFRETMTAWSNLVGVDIVQQAVRAASDRT